MGYEGMAAKIMAKHAKEEHRSSLSITVIEARGLRPRHGNCFLLVATASLAPLLLCSILALEVFVL